MFNFGFYNSIRPKPIWMLGGGGAPWTPADIATDAWYDASDTSPTNIIQSGGLVSQLTDKGSTGTEHLVQSTGSSQMSTGLQTMNSLNTLSSTAVNKFMEHLTFPVPASGNFSITFSARIDGQSFGFTPSLVSMDADSHDWQLQSVDNYVFLGSLSSANIGSTDALTGGPFTGPDIWTVTFDFDGGVKKTYVNGIETSSGTYTAKVASSQIFRLFANRAPSAYIFGLFGEMVINEDCTVDCRQKIEGYLAWKWGMVANLPIGHPYKTNPPTV